MYRSILVPLDGSPFAEQALPLASSIARRAEATLSLVRVWESPYRFVTELAPPELSEQPEDRLAAERYLEQTADALRSTVDLRVETAVLDGDVTDSILDHASSAGCDLVVLTTHGRTGFSRAWLGSVADSVLRAAAIPILLHRPAEQADPPAEQFAMKRILIPLDGSREAEQIMSHVIALGRVFSSHYFLVNVVPPVAMQVQPYTYTAPAALQIDPVVTKQSVARAERYLRTVAQRVTAEHAGADVEIDVRMEARAGFAIVDAVREHRADLVALTTHARRGVRLLIGSVADKVLRGTHGAVLALRPTRE